jgi:hypothetical protein
MVGARLRHETGSRSLNASRAVLPRRLSHLGSSIPDLIRSSFDFSSVRLTKEWSPRAHPIPTSTLVGPGRQRLPENSRMRQKLPTLPLIDPASAAGGESR